MKKPFALSFLAALFLAVAGTAAETPAAAKNDAKNVPTAKVVPAENNKKQPGKQQHPQQNNKLYSKLSGEEQERLFYLYEENPSAYFDEIRKVTAELRRRDRELNAKAVQTAVKYRKSENPEEKKKLLSELTELTKQQLKIRMDDTGRRLLEAEQRLKEIRNIYEQRKKNANEIVSRRVEDLIREPGLKW